MTSAFIAISKLKQINMTEKELQTFYCIYHKKRSENT